MAIISESWKIQHNKKEYLPGETVHLPEEEEQRLVDDGIAQFVDDPADNDDGDKPMTVKELAEYLQSEDDPAAVTDLLEIEQASESPRKSAIKLLEERLSELEGAGKGANV